MSFSAQKPGIKFPLSASCLLCRFLTRLLLVHGSLSAYRLSRLIKYSFYKNIAFGFLLFFYQFYCGFSGQSMVDDISAAAFNVVFTSLPILLFAVLDRPVHNLNTLLRFPQVSRLLPYLPINLCSCALMCFQAGAGLRKLWS